MIFINPFKIRNFFNSHPYQKIFFLNFFKRCEADFYLFLTFFGRSFFKKMFQKTKKIFHIFPIIFVNFFREDILLKLIFDSNTTTRLKKQQTNFFFLLLIVAQFLFHSQLKQLLNQTSLLKQTNVVQIEILFFCYNVKKI